MTAHRIGAMRHRITIERAIPTPDEGGGSTLAWERYCDAWAEIEAKSGSEIVASGGVKGRVSHTMRIRYRPGITSAMRVVLGERRFDIVGVRDPDGRTRGLYLDVEERLP
ncbi:MAG: phage head closure protein [Hyphomicrobium sp.]|nr:phage head closure protein [Hyphomicrobium sp.]